MYTEEARWTYYTPRGGYVVRSEHNTAEEAEDFARLWNIGVLQRGHAEWIIGIIAGSDGTSILMGGAE